MNLKITTALIFFLLAYGKGSVCKAQEMTTMGTDFWVTCMTFSLDVIASSPFPQGAVPCKTELDILSPRQCTMNITNPNTGWDTTINVLPMEYVTLNLYYDFRRLSDTIHGYVFHITTTDSIALFALTRNGGHMERALILPTHLLGNEYIIQTYQNSLHGSSIEIIATQDSTELLVVPKSNTLSGHLANVPFSVMLPQAGQCLQLQTTFYTDLTGTTVGSTKPVAVFQGNPDAITNQYDGADPNDPYFVFSDHRVPYYEQAVPVNRWGRRFVVPHSSINRHDKIIVLSSANNCNVYKNGQFVSMLQEGQYYKYETDDDSTTDYIVTTKPSLVTLYPFSTWNQTTRDYCTGSMTTIAPWEWKTTNCYFSTQQYPGIMTSNDTKLHVIAKSDDTSSIVLDGQSIAHHFTSIPNNPVYSVARLDIPLASTHHLYCEHCEGFTGYIISSEARSMGSMIGSCLPEIRNQLVVDNIVNADIYDTITACVYENLLMAVVTLYGNDSVRWYLGDGATTTGDTVWHSYTNAGTYQITAIAFASCDTCYHPIDTLRTHVMVMSSDTTFSDSLVCGSQFVWQDSTYTHDGLLEQRLHNSNGCDSLNIISLHLRNITSKVVDSIEGCDSTYYGNNWYNNNDTVAYDTLINSQGCDSIVYHSIIVNTSYDKTHEINIYDTDSLIWIDGNIYTEATDEPYVVLTSRQGCDSIIHLTLNILPSPLAPIIDSSSLWIPNTFTPNENSNNVFHLFCNDLLSAETSIFSRQGLHICTFDGLTEHWDGTYKGRPCTQGAYVYIIKYTTKAQPQVTKTKTGTVLLVR